MAATEDGANKAEAIDPAIELFRSLFAALQSSLSPEKAKELKLLEGHLINIAMKSRATATPPRAIEDKRRTRFLLRLIVGNISHFFRGTPPILPWSVIEGVDEYLKKSFGNTFYSELNDEVKQLFSTINFSHDKEMLSNIFSDPYKGKFVDTIFIRILFRFENFSAGRSKFIAIVDKVTTSSSKFHFDETSFRMIFDALFNRMAEIARDEKQRVRWDFYFGDGTSKKIIEILKNKS